MFLPKQVLIEEKALEYERGQSIESFFIKRGVPVRHLKSARVQLSGESSEQKYRSGKDLLFVGVRKISAFQSCKPSAHYQLPLVSGCMGMCEYCYLQTQMSKRPYVKIYANVEEVLDKADIYIAERLPEMTVFEGAATSDPLPLEPYTRLLETAILHFAATETGRFRFVTKFNDVDSLIELKHRGHTEIRVSLNINDVIQKFEHRTPSFEKRLEAIEKLRAAGYPIGILIAPVFWCEENRTAYQDLIHCVGAVLGGDDCTVEVISHRFTATAKKSILSVFPHSLLPMDEQQRTYRVGQFGYGKYTYPKEEIAEYKAFFQAELTKYFKEEKILYLI